LYLYLLIISGKLHRFTRSGWSGVRIGSEKIGCRPFKTTRTNHARTIWERSRHCGRCL